MLKFLSPSCAFCLALLTAVNSHSAPVLDQTNTSGGGGWPAIFTSSPSSYQISQQNITVGIAGELSRVDLALVKYSGQGPFGTGTVNIKDLANNVLATSTFSVASLTEHNGSPASFISFDFSLANLIVSVGQLLQIEVSHDSSGWAAWDVGGSYAGGDSFVQHPLSTSPPGSDYRFSTFVDALEVPEPNTALLLGTAILGLSVLRRTKRAP